MKERAAANLFSAHFCDHQSLNSFSCNYSNTSLLDYVLRRTVRATIYTHQLDFVTHYYEASEVFIAFTDSPAVDTSILTHPSLPMSAPGTPDLLVNSLELKRTLRKWSHDKEKVIRVKW